VKRQLKIAADAAGEALEEQVQLQVEEAIMNELKKFTTEEALLEVAETVIDICLPGLGFMIKMVRYSTKACWNSGKWELTKTK
jgi:hypothetical protein